MGTKLIVLLVIESIALLVAHRIEPDILICEAAVQRIQPGMTQAEVEAIFGGHPWTDYSLLRHVPCVPSINWKYAIWYGDRGSLTVKFDGPPSEKARRVEEVSFARLR